jgi:hypothetical protein
MSQLPLVHDNTVSRQGICGCCMSQLKGKGFQWEEGSELTAAGYSSIRIANLQVQVCKNKYLLILSAHSSFFFYPLKKRKCCTETCN